MNLRRFASRALLISFGAAPLVGCGSDESPPPSGASGSTCDPDHSVCNEGLACEEASDGNHRCYQELFLRGQVEDGGDGKPIKGARVMAVDEEGSAITDVAETDAEGHYELAVPTPRDSNGAPANAKFTLRAAAQNYQAFPYGPRVALPIDAREAMAQDGDLVVENALTTIDLIPLADGERSAIKGTVVAAAAHTSAPIGGLLVVASGADGAVSGLSDKSGGFEIFNVPAGSHELKAYGAGIQVESKSVTVGASPLEGVELHEVEQATTTVSGSVQLVNAPGGSRTSVILVVEDTFDPNVVRGEAPRGLRSPKTGAPDVNGAFMIAGVPAGKYVVLAAYENDDLVRDPDTAISGTDIVHVEVTAGQASQTLDASFKVTGALATVSPGIDAPEAVTGKPDLVWEDDSSEDGYDLRVFDALGNEVWKSLGLPAVKGSAHVTVPYQGPLEPGMYYQFRVTSWRDSKGLQTPISSTEDLRGVFFVPTP
ncbi:MAG TPA: hypothetical protein VER12_18145 [Polyangiaceae bacterium]|nr:hypothetical protein [Polyangiaceae bacterium]